MPGCNGTGTAERSYPASKVSGGQEETPCVRGQGGGLEEPTLCLRPVVARRRHPDSEIRGGQEKPQATSCPRPGAVTLRSHPEPETRAGCREEQPEEWWLPRHRRA